MFPDPQECACCFGETAVHKLVWCPQGHAVCTGCVKRYVKERVFTENKTDLR